MEYRSLFITYLLPLQDSYVLVCRQSDGANAILPIPTYPPRRVDDRKDAERQAYVQRRAERATRPERGLDPFPLNVQRSVQRSTGDEPDQVHIQAPTVLADFSGKRVFYSTAALDVLLNKLDESLAGMKDTPLVTLKHKAAKVGTSPPDNRIAVIYKVATTLKEMFGATEDVLSQQLLLYPMLL